ncbi:MAG: cobalt ECF transporter T component CbiQ [Bacillota bacterium]|jgi:cobalt/nickel transport system permease protein
MIIVDKLCYSSRLRYMNAGEKFAFAIITLLICVVSRSILCAAVILAATAILTVKIGGIPLSRYRTLMAVPLTFILLSTLAIIVNFSHTPLDAFAIPLGSIYVTGSWHGIYRAFQLIITAMAAVSCLYFLSLNTPMTDILEVLRRLRCPLLFIELMMLIYRFLFVLLEIASSITTSQRSRLGNKDLKTAYHSFSNMVSVLFVRAIKKSNALFDAMESRCYDGRIRVLNETFPPKAKEIIAIVCFEVFLLICIIGGKLLL